MDDPRTREDIADLKKAHAGGVILFDRDLGTGGDRNIRSPEQLKELIEDLRHELGRELIVSIDQEGGRVARLREERGFLRSIAPSEIGRQDDSLAQTHARDEAAQLGALGINLNFAPCVDLAINPESAIIAKKGRSFSADPSIVNACTSAIIDVYQNRRIRCCIKHFPGHGSTTGDTHDGLVDITGTHQPEEIEPYAELLRRFGDSICVMTGHLMHRDRDPEYPASLSHAITTGWLREELGFDGVIVTDSLDMGGASIDGAPLLAANAGADILLYGNNTPTGFIEGMATKMHRELLAGIEPERAFEAAARIERAFR